MNSFNLELQTSTFTFSNKDYNDLKWIDSILMGFTIFQIIFFMGYSYISLVVVIIQFFISYQIFKIWNSKKINIDLEISNTLESIQNIFKSLLACLIICIIDLILNITYAHEVTDKLLSTNDEYRIKFVYFSYFIMLTRISFLTFIWIFIKRLVKKEILSL
jgi:hypothetical protein